MRYVILLTVVLACGCSGPYHLSGGPDASTDATAISHCGDGVLDPDEECDRFAFDGLDCSDLGFDLGALSCREDCTADDSKCGYLER